MKLLFLLLLTIAAAAARCPDSSWVQVEERCFWASEFVVPWSSVSAVCGSFTGVSASPASVHDQVANSNLAKMLQGKQAWLGLSRPDATADWGWEDGSDEDFTYWSAGEPSENGDCAIINHNTSTSQWGAEDCSADHPAVCQVTALSGCPAGWAEHDGKCYWYSGDYLQTSWKAASAECFFRGPWGQLASIHSAELNSYLLSLIHNHYVWAGLHLANSSASWTWSDGSDVDFTNWLSGEPTSGYNCASLYLYNGEWYSLSCSTTAPFLCQADL